MDPMTMMAISGLLGGGGTEVTQSSSNTTNVGTSIQLSNMSSGGQKQDGTTSASGSSSATPSGEGGTSYPSVYPAGAASDYGSVTVGADNPDYVAPLQNISTPMMAAGGAAVAGIVYLLLRKKGKR